jgi:hypothetical protein
LAFSSQFATANEVSATPADSLNFKPAAVTTSQTISPGAGPSEILNMTTVKPYQAPAAVPGQIPGTVPGQPLMWQPPNQKKSNAKKDDSQSQKMMQQLGQMLGGGSGNSAQKSSPAAAYADNSKTEAGFCYECTYGQHNGTSGLDMNKVSGYVNADSITDMNEKEKCYAKYLEGELPDALAHTPFAGQTHSGGQCAKGVRMLLTNAGLSKGQSLGNAVEYASGKDIGVGNRGAGSLARLGFRKLEGYTAANAPAGAVLVFGGPKSKDYMAGRVGSDGTGTTLGHVTIKGRDGYYTDGKTTNPAGQRRYLVGVYVMSTCANCNPNVKARCEGAGGSK